jgi:hypothetical protein
MACRGFCRDECIAISVIAAAQHDRCPALRACAFALTDASEIGGMLDEATQFAQALKVAKQELAPQAVCNVAAFAGQMDMTLPN